MGSTRLWEIVLLAGCGKLMFGEQAGARESGLVFVLFCFVLF